MPALGARPFPAPPPMVPPPGMLPEKKEDPRSTAARGRGPITTMTTTTTGARAKRRRRRRRRRRPECEFSFFERRQNRRRRPDWIGRDGRRKRSRATTLLQAPSAITTYRLRRRHVPCAAMGVLVLKTGMPQWTCRRRCRCVVMAGVGKDLGRGAS